MIYFVSRNINSNVLKNNNITLTGIEKVIEDLQNETEICLDTETTGYSPIYNDIILLQFGTLKGNQYVIDTRDFEVNHFKHLLESETKTFIGHNIKFDYNMLKKHGIVLRNVYDTMIVDKVIFNGAYGRDFIRKNKRFSLAGVYKHYFNKYIEKKIREDFVRWRNKPFTYDQITYAALDALYPFHIKEKQLELVKKYLLEEAVKLENKVVLAIGDIEYNGMRLDPVKWRNVVNKYKIRAEQSETKLDEMLLLQPGTQKYKKIATQLTLFDEPEDKRKSIINWNSDQQVYEVLSNIFKIYPKDKHGKPSSGADAIEMLSTSHPFTNLLLKYREETKVITSFGEKFLGKLNPDSRIRTSFNQIMNTGRVSSSNPNMQQIKRYNKEDPDSKYFREAFCVKEDKCLSTADYSQQEARIMADMADDKDYIKFFNEDGGDSHSFVATKLFSAKFKKEFKVSKTENEEYRYKGKILNFSISFGIQANTLSKRLNVSIEEAQELIDAFYEGFPTLKIFFEKSHEEALFKGYIRTNNITNRIRWFPEWRKYLELKDNRSRDWSGNKELSIIEGIIKRRAQNTKIQGTAGDMTKLALVYIRTKLIENNILPLYEASVKLVNVIHDETVLESIPELVNKWSTIQRECMEKAGEAFCKKVKITADFSISQHWEH
jgi:DNA polymerase-1